MRGVGKREVRDELRGIGERDGYKEMEGVGERGRHSLSTPGGQSPSSITPVQVIGAHLSTKSSFGCACSGGSEPSQRAVIINVLKTDNYEGCEDSLRPTGENGCHES